MKHSPAANAKHGPRPSWQDHVTYLTSKGKTTHAVLPIQDYQQLVRATAHVESIPPAVPGGAGLPTLELTREEADEIQIMLDDPHYEWLDAEDVRAKHAARRLTEARKARGMTQAELGKKLGIPQSQVSRLEKNPDRTSVAMLKKVAKALGADVAELLTTK